MKTKLAFLICLTLPLLAFADADQMMGEQTGSQDAVDKVYGKKKADDTYVSNGVTEVEHSVDQDYKKVKVENTFIPEHSAELLSAPNKLGDTVRDPGILPLGALDHQANYIENSYSEINKRLGDKGRKSYKIAYFFKDDVTYKSENNSFDRTFNKGPNNVRTGLLMVGYESYLNRRWIDFFWGINGGLSFRRGQGNFTSDQSPAEDAYINLWSLPLDLALGFNMPLSPWFGVAAQGGPSAMALFQSRSDRGDGEKGKRRSQLSPGYFADAQFRFSLSDIWPGGSFKMYSDYGITKLWLNIEGRYHSYNQFQQKDVKVNGTSLGLSFTFELI